MNLIRIRPAAIGGLLLAATIVPVLSQPTQATPAVHAAPTVTDTPATRAAERQLDAVPVPRIRWERCAPKKYDLAQAPDRRARCAMVAVPLDYDRPHGPTIDLAVGLFRATGRSRGTLFFNQGGPGAAAIPFVANRGGVAISPRVDRHLDVVGIDPRGTGASDRATCAVGDAKPRRDPSFPFTAADERTWLRADRTLRRICRTGPSALVDHASTADSARDLELVRRALGEPRVNYYGLSWGSYLGATYAAMFPSRVRTLMVDGVIDPVAWSGSRRVAGMPYPLRMKAHVASHEALVAALAECDRVGPATCPLAPEAGRTWEAVLDAARKNPRTAFAQPLTYNSLVYWVFGALYNRDYVLPTFEWIAQLYDESRAADTPAARTAPAVEVPPVLVRQAAALRRAGLFAAPTGRAPWTTDVLFDATVCSDTRNPQRPGRYPAIAARADRQAPWMGRLWAWSASPCADGGIGSSADAYRGPWRVTTAAPVLVVGSTYDPATPYRGAQALHRLLPGSRLLTFDGWGHTAIGKSACVKRVMGRYLVDARLPARGATCRPTLGLFDPPDYDRRARR